MSDLQHVQREEPVPMELYQQSNGSPPIVYQPQQQQHMVSPSFEQVPVSQQIDNSTFEQSNVVASLSDEWNPPSINDAIATNKVGFQNGTADIVLKSRPESPLEMSVDDRNSFLKTLQQLNDGVPTSGTQLGLDSNGMLVNEPVTSVSLQQQMETSLANGQIISSST